MMPMDQVLRALAGPVLERLLSRLSADDRVVGVTAGGSAVTGTMDEYSDLDLVVVCRPGQGAAVRAGIVAVAAAAGPLLAAFTGEHVGEPRLTIALYGPPALHVDLKTIEVADLAERVEDGLILWERADDLRNAMAAAPARWPAPDPQWIEDRFWVWIHYAATKIARGEFFECLDALSLLRSAALGPLIAVRHGQRPQGVRRIEQYAPEDADALRATVGDHSRTGCALAVRAGAELYRRLRPDAIVRRSGAEREALAYLARVEPAGSTNGPATPGI